MIWLSTLSFAAWWLTVLIALVFRSRAYALFRGVQLGVHTLIAIAIAPLGSPVFPVFAVLHALVYVQSVALARPRPRPLWYHALVSIPAAYFGAATLLALPWAVVAAL